MARSLVSPRGATSPVKTPRAPVHGCVVRGGVVRGGGGHPPAPPQLASCVPPPASCVRHATSCVRTFCPRSKRFFDNVNVFIYERFFDDVNVFICVVDLDPFFGSCLACPC